MEDITKELDRYEDITTRLITALEKVSAPGTVSGNGNANININAGGIGVLVTSCLAAFMCGMCIFLALQVWHEQKQLDDMHDYLNVIYQYAPQLKPKDFH